MDSIKIRDQFIKIIILNWAEQPIEEIQGRATGGSINLNGQGRATGGSINLNGNSSIRRTANINILIDSDNADITNVKNSLSISKKVKLEIGLKNYSSQYTDYPIIWYPLGVYVISSVQISHSTGANVVATLQLKDKMCLLNGECGGTLPASVTFDSYDTLTANGTYETKKDTIYKIIRYVVNYFGNEQLSKIIISDVDERIRKVMKWIGANPLYITQYTQNQRGLNRWI